MKNKFGLEHHHADDIKFCKGVIQKQDQTLKMDSTEVLRKGEETEQDVKDSGRRWSKRKRKKNNERMSEKQNKNRLLHQHHQKFKRQGYTNNNNLKMLKNVSEMLKTKLLIGHS